MFGDCWSEGKVGWKRIVVVNGWLTITGHEYWSTGHLSTVLALRLRPGFNLAYLAPFSNRFKIPQFKKIFN